MWFSRVWNAIFTHYDEITRFARAFHAILTRFRHGLHPYRMRFQRGLHVFSMCFQRTLYTWKTQLAHTLHAFRMRFSHMLGTRFYHERNAISTRTVRGLRRKKKMQFSRSDKAVLRENAIFKSLECRSNALLQTLRTPLCRSFRCRFASDGVKRRTQFLLLLLFRSTQLCRSFGWICVVSYLEQKKKLII